VSRKPRRNDTPPCQLAITTTWSFTVIDCEPSAQDKRLNSIPTYYSQSKSRELYVTCVCVYICYYVPVCVLHMRARSHCPLYRRRDAGRARDENEYRFDTVIFLLSITLFLFFVLVCYVIIINIIIILLYYYF